MLPRDKSAMERVVFVVTSVPPAGRKKIVRLVAQLSVDIWHQVLLPRPVTMRELKSGSKKIEMLIFLGRDSGKLKTLSATVGMSHSDARTSDEQHYKAKKPHSKLSISPVQKIKRSTISFPSVTL